MKLLLIVHLLLLPLEALRPRWSDAGQFAVVEKKTVLSVSPEATKEGVRLGMRSGGVAAVSPATMLLERAPERETASMDAIATALMQFTPEVTFQEYFSVLLDVRASLRLFGGPQSICHSVKHTVEALGFTAQIGAAPTAQGTWLT